MKIKFVISPYRKRKKRSFNPVLSEYWENQYQDMFRRWDNEK